MALRERNPKCHRRRLTFQSYANVKADWTESRKLQPAPIPLSRFSRIPNTKQNNDAKLFLRTKVTFISFQVKKSCTHWLLKERIWGNLFWQCDLSLCLALTGFVKNHDSFFSTEFSPLFEVFLKLSGKKFVLVKQILVILDKGQISA